MGRKPRRIERPRLLLVEGIEDLRLCEGIQKYLDNGSKNFDSIQLWDYGGINKLKSELKNIFLTPQYPTLCSIGIIADADNNANQRFQMIQKCLRECSYPVPDSQLIPTSGNSPSVVVVVVPKNGGGMIEKLCLDSVMDDPATGCVTKYFDCLNAVFTENHLECPRNIYKARLQAFLASRKSPGLTMGYAALRNYFPFENEAFDDIKEIMKQMIK